MGKVEGVITKERKCPICGETFKIEHPNQRYCQAKCKITARKRSIELTRQRNQEKQNRKRKLRKKITYEAIGNEYKRRGNLMNQYHTGKGTSNLNEHPNPDTNKEEVLIMNEMKRLKLEGCSKLINTKGKEAI